MTVDTLQLSQEFVAGPSRIRFDVLGSEPVGDALADKDFLDYRLADVAIAPQPTLDAPDIVWERDAEKSIEYDGRWMTFRGDWASGPIQKVLVTMLALRLEGEASTRSTPRPFGIATRRCSSSVASRTTANPWVRSRPAGAARSSSRPRRP